MWEGPPDGGHDRRDGRDEPERPAGAHQRGSHVLVVDDDPATREMLLEFLRLEGVVAEGARDGVAALAHVEVHPPGLILLDMRMPLLDGTGFAAAYRAMPGPPAPIIVMTASMSLVDAAGASIHPAHTLLKPFDLADLLGLIRQTVETVETVEPAGGSTRRTQPAPSRHVAPTACRRKGPRPLPGPAVTG